MASERCPQPQPQLKPESKPQSKLKLISKVLHAVDTGLKQARDAQNARLEEDQARGNRLEEPRYEYGIIACALRMFLPIFSRCDTHRKQLRPPRIPLPHTPQCP